MTTSLDRAADLQVQTPPQARVIPQQTPAAQAQPPTPATPATPARPLSRGRAGQLALRGRLSGPDRSWLQPELEELVASGARVIEIDLSRVSYVDAAIARLLLRTEWRLGDAARRLLLVGPAPQVRRCLQWCGGRHLVVR